jgi:hypothetical protein
VAHNWPTTGPLPISIGNNLISDLAYLFSKKPLPKSKFGLLLAEHENQKNSWQHIFFPIISRKDYLILVVSSLQCKNNCRNQIWATIIYRGEMVKPKLDYVP